MLYIFDHISDFTEERYNKYISFLPLDRLARAKGYMRMADRKECVIAYLLFRLGILLEYDIHDAPVLSYGIFGKPYLAEYPHIHINLSHCRQGIACAISNGDVGVDIQDWIVTDNRLLTRVCSSEEMERVMKSNEKDKLFTAYWTLKEAFIKNLGVGMSLSMKCCDFSSVEQNMFEKFGKMFSLLFTEDYCLAVCDNSKFIGARYILIQEFEQLL
jgi:4'-phosphopantetheinyl transferase